MPPLIDEETKQMILKKTWCHGQSIAPLYGIVCIWWYFSLLLTSQSSSTSSNSLLPTTGLLLIGFGVMPAWSYLSYEAVFASPSSSRPQSQTSQSQAASYRTLMAGGSLVELCHAYVFCLSLDDLKDSTFHLLMCIASGLFFVETFAFLVVVASFGHTSRRTMPMPIDDGGQQQQQQQVLAGGGATSYEGCSDETDLPSALWWCGGLTTLWSLTGRHTSKASISIVSARQKESLGCLYYMLGIFHLKLLTNVEMLTF